MTLECVSLKRVSLSAGTRIKWNNEMGLLYKQNKCFEKISESYVHTVRLEFSLDDTCPVQTIISLERCCCCVRDFIAHRQ